MCCKRVRLCNETQFKSIACTLHVMLFDFEVESVDGLGGTEDK